MSEKQAKKERKEPKVLAEFTITILDDGNVNVNGPVENLIAFFDATNRAGRMVLNHAAQNMQKMQSNIIVPNIDTSKLKLH